MTAQPGTATQPLAPSPVTVVDQGKGQPQSPTVTAPDPEQELVNGNVDLAHSALELAAKRASGAPGVADSEKAYRQASDRQAARLEKAGYPSETWNGQSADANWQ